MPIISRTLTKLANREDLGSGIKTWRANGTDGRGRPWIHASFRGTQIEAEAIRDAAWTTRELANQDLDELIDWVEARNTVASFDYTNRDIDQDAGEEFVMIEFARRLGDQAIKLAWWVESLNPPTFGRIRDRIGWTNEEGTIVQDRAIGLLAAEEFYNTTVKAS